VAWCANASLTTIVHDPAATDVTVNVRFETVPRVAIPLHPLTVNDVPAPGSAIVTLWTCDVPLNASDVGKTDSGPGVGVGDGVGVGVGVAVGGDVGVAVGDDVGVGVGDAAGVDVGGDVGVDVGVDVAVGVALGVIVGVAVAFGVGDGDAVPFTVTGSVDACPALSAMVIDALPLWTPETVKAEYETRGETIAIDVSELDAVNAPTYPASLTTICALDRAALSTSIVPPVGSE
jgi:hypothetical protein